MLIIVQSVQDLSLMTMLIKIDILIIVHIIATSILSMHKIPLLTWYFGIGDMLVIYGLKNTMPEMVNDILPVATLYFTMVHFPQWEAADI